MQWKFLKFLTAEYSLLKSMAHNATNIGGARLALHLEGAVNMVRCMKHQTSFYAKADWHVDLEQIDRDTRFFEI